MSRIIFRYIFEYQCHYIICLARSNNNPHTTAPPQSVSLCCSSNYLCSEVPHTGIQLTMVCWELVKRLLTRINASSRTIYRLATRSQETLTQVCPAAYWLLDYRNEYLANSSVKGRMARDGRSMGSHRSISWENWENQHSSSSTPKHRDKSTCTNWSANDGIRY